MRYLIVKYDIFNKTKEISDWTTDPCKAYEWAHELDAFINIGLDDNESNGNKNPCIITIEDEDGNSAWHECARIRCPSIGIFQS
jgi:hypothetical protein